MSALPPIADIPRRNLNVRFSNRPVGVKRFQTIHNTVSRSLASTRFSSETAHRPFHHGIRGRGGSIFRATLPAAKRVIATCEAISPKSAKGEERSCARLSGLCDCANDCYPPCLGLPNLQVINRDVHVVKSADEAAYRQSTRSLSLKTRVIEGNCGSRAQSPALAAHGARSYLCDWSAMVGGDDPH